MTRAFRPDPKARARRVRTNRIFVGLCLAATGFSIISLGVLLVTIGLSGAGQLWGLDRDARDAAMAPQTLEATTDFAVLDRVDWAQAASDLDLPALASLARVDFAALGTGPQDLWYAPEIADVDWSEVHASPPLEDVETLAGLDWATIVERVRTPGAGRLAATVRHSRLGSFLFSAPSRKPEQAGIWPPLIGTVWICVVCAFFALPIGVGTAVFLEEYKPHGRTLRRLHGFIQLNISNLAGVPSIVYGIIGLTAFVGMFGIVAMSAPIEIGDPDAWYHLRIPFGRSVLAGGLTLMLVILPIVIISTQEALRAVPDSLRQGSLALGATRWQTIRGTTLPAAVPGIMTGAILAMSRAIGEAAPVLVVCGTVFILSSPSNLMGDFTALPLQIYNWAGRPQAGFHAIAASGIIILLVVLLTFNAAAIIIRQKFQKPLQ